jgi:hypothetical protein
LQRKQVQKIDREDVQQRRRQAQVLLIILQCSLLYMQLSLGWVCVLRQKLLITINCCFKCTYNGQIAHDYKVPYDGCGRIWPGWQLHEILAFGESWLMSVHPKWPLFRKFAADNAITVECETWVELSFAWAISYNRWNACLPASFIYFHPVVHLFYETNKSSMSQMEHQWSFMKNQPMN